MYYKFLSHIHLPPNMPHKSTYESSIIKWVELVERLNEQKLHFKIILIMERTTIQVYYLME